MTLKRFIVCDKCGEILPFLDADFDQEDNHVKVCFVSKDGMWSAFVDFCPRCASNFLISIRDISVPSLKEAIVDFIGNDTLLAYSLKSHK